MTTKIIGREQELLLLKQALNSDRAEFLAVYGRRRVGKTFLLDEFFKPHFVFTFSGAFEQDSKTQINNFFKEYMRTTKGTMETTMPENWSDVFSYLTDFLYALEVAPNQKAVVFIDEMPWLDTPRSGFVSALEYFWNQHGSKMHNLLLIACGSTASWMKKKLLKSKGGLYNRVTKRLKLEPFNLRQTAEYCRQKHLKFSHYQIVQLYSVMGGIPFYLNELSKGKSVTQLIEEIGFTPAGLLADEYEQLYYSLFNHAETHIEIVETLAKHPYGLVRNQMLKKSTLSDSGTFSRALEDLLESGFVLKFQPFGKKAKEGIYRLMDMYSLFYLRFIKGNVSNRPNTWQTLSTGQAYTVWSGYAFENICLLHTTQILKKLGLTGTFTQFSSWYHKGTDEMPGAQVDLVIDRKDGLIHLCEAKFSNKEFILSKEYAAVLRRKRAIFEQVTQTKKKVVTTLITTYPAIQNQHYLDEIHSEVTIEDLFDFVRLA